MADCIFYIEKNPVEWGILICISSLFHSTVPVLGSVQCRTDIVIVKLVVLNIWGIISKKKSTGLQSFCAPPYVFPLQN